MSLPYTGRGWTIEVPVNVPLLNANDRLNHYAQADRIRTLRELAAWRAKAQRIPKIECAHIIGYVLVQEQHKRRDPANWHPTAKALVDGIVIAKVLPDDDYMHVRGPELLLIPAMPRAGFVLRIRELEYMPEAAEF